MLIQSQGFATQFPHLFNEVTWPWGRTRAKFMLLDRVPQHEEIANVDIVPRIGENWVMLQLSDGSWDIPGGTLEPGEGYLDAIQRELMEEAGARLISHQLIGAWWCQSLAEKPYRPHLPFPYFYRLVLTGEIEIERSPDNPIGAEKVISIASAALEVVVDRFVAQKRYDLAELYQLASGLRD